MQLLKFRNDKNLSRRDVIFALEKDGVSIVEQTLANWESGLYEPNVSDAIALAKVYGVRVEELIA